MNMHHNIKLTLNRALEVTRTTQGETISWTLRSISSLRGRTHVLLWNGKSTKLKWQTIPFQRSIGIDGIVNRKLISPIQCICIKYLSWNTSHWKGCSSMASIFYYCSSQLLCQSRAPVAAIAWDEMATNVFWPWCFARLRLTSSGV